MIEPIAATTEEARPVEPRRLHPGIAFLGGLLGFGVGYFYVGRIRYAIAFLVGAHVVFFGAAWTRWPLTPFGWYSFFAGAVLLWLAQLAHPMALAWSRPLAPAKPYNRWWGYVAWIAAVMGLSFVLDPTTAFGYGNYYVPSGAMSPTVTPGDRVVADTWRYRDTPPAPGDIVIFKFDDEFLLIKRVVGVPGDTIELRGPLLVRNGSPVDEPYLNLERGSRPPDVAPLTLGADEFFILGDNRGNSYDSRLRGPVARDHIYGRVEFIYFSTAGGGVAWERFPVVLGGD